MRPHFPSFVRLARVSAGLVRLFGIFVRCLGFYYDISAITMVRPSERDTNRHIGREGRRGQDQDIDFLVDKSPESLAWIWGYWRQLRLACLAWPSVTRGYNIIVTQSECKSVSSVIVWFVFYVSTTAFEDVTRVDTWPELVMGIRDT